VGATVGLGGVVAVGWGVSVGGSVAVGAGVEVGRAVAVGAGVSVGRDVGVGPVVALGGAVGEGLAVAGAMVGGGMVSVAGGAGDGVAPPQPATNTTTPTTIHNSQRRWRLISDDLETQHSLTFPFLQVWLTERPKRRKLGAR
jgi:UDP-3-O-[3-hydroxymyristoyl] glucosamine N-acyltransferase